VLDKRLLIHIAVGAEGWREAEGEELMNGKLNSYCGLWPNNPDWNCLPANQISSSFKTNNLICWFRPLTTIIRPDTTVA
jgi:hypothetical protein